MFLAIKRKAKTETMGKNHRTEESQGLEGTSRERENLSSCNSALQVFLLLQMPCTKPLVACNLNPVGPK